MKNKISLQNEIVKFNVGGSYFCTLSSNVTRKIRKENTTQVYEPHLLEELYYETLKDNKEIPMIDRSSVNFNFILDYLRDPDDEILLPANDLNYKELIDEAKYFKLEGLYTKLEKLEKLPILAETKYKAKHKNQIMFYVITFGIVVSLSLFFKNDNFLIYNSIDEKPAFKTDLQIKEMKRKDNN